MAQDVYPVSPMGGFLIDSNGDKVNIADIMGTVTPISGWEVNPKNFPAYPLCVAGSDGKVYNLADLLKSAGGGGGGGSGGGVLVLHADENGTLDKTWAEIKNAMSTMIVKIYTAGYADDIYFWNSDIVQSVTKTYSIYSVFTPNGNYSASAEDQYPTLE